VLQKSGFKIIRTGISFDRDRRGTAGGAGWLGERAQHRGRISPAAPIERFRLADRSLAADDPAVTPVSAPAAAAANRPAGVSRWVNANGRISLAGFSYAVGATYAGEPVEVVVAGGLVDILHARVVVATHA